jgi:quercetin dioxygenase-like cupin family protein
LEIRILFMSQGVETNGKYAVVEISSPPGGGPPLHSHTKETEGFYVIDGEFSFQHGDNKTLSKPGAFLHLEEKIFILENKILAMHR